MKSKRFRKIIATAMSVAIMLTGTISASAETGVSDSQQVKQYNTDIVALKMDLTGSLQQVTKQRANEAYPYSDGDGSLRSINYVSSESAILLTKDPKFDGRIECFIEEYVILDNGNVEQFGYYRVGIDEAGREEYVRNTAAQTPDSVGDSVENANMAGDSNPMCYFVDQTYMGEYFLGSDAEIKDIPTKIEFRNYGFVDNQADLHAPAEDGLTCAYNFGREDRIYRFVFNMYPSDGSDSWVAYNFRVKDEATRNYTAAPNSSKVLVNGNAVDFDAYTINQNNYFKLRDLAQILSGTSKQFDVTWDGAKNAINLISGKPYTAVGGEMARGDGTAKQAQANESAIYLDGELINLAAYTINGNNYFKLRDIGAAFEFSVSWDGASNTIAVDTSKGYAGD